MKQVLFSSVAIALLCFAALSFLALQTKATTALPWKDDFNYATKEDMKAAGWRLDNENMLSVGGGTLTIDNDGSTGGSAYYLNQFPNSVYEFIAEDRVMWIDRSYGGPRILINTTRHSYIWAADAYYHKYIFDRDDVRVLNFGDYTPQLNEWQIFSVRKQGNTLYLYQDNELKNTYVEPDVAPDTLQGVAVISHWEGTLKYDYIHVGLTVGGIVAPTGKLGILAPYIGLASVVAIAAVASVVYVKRIRCRTENQ